MGYTVEERNLSVDEIVEAHKKGLLQEVFGVGTAAVVSYIVNLTYKDYRMDFDLDKQTVAPSLKQHLHDIRVGNVPDKHNWLEKV